MSDLLTNFNIPACTKDGLTRSSCLCVLRQALSHQQKAVLISERVLGIDHPNTIQEYVSVKHIVLI